MSPVFTAIYRRGFLPTYSSILIALAVSGVGAGEFLLAMLPLVAALFFIGTCSISEGTQVHGTEDGGRQEKGGGHAV